MIHRIGKLLRMGMTPTEITIAVRTTIIASAALLAVLFVGWWL